MSLVPASPCPIHTRLEVGLPDPVGNQSATDLVARDGIAVSIVQRGILDGDQRASGQQRASSDYSDFHRSDSICSLSYRLIQTELNVFFRLPDISRANPNETATSRPCLAGGLS